MTSTPLVGLRIVVTRASQDAQPLLAQLARLGATAIHAPTLAFAPPRDPQRFRDAVNTLDSYDWAVFTSAHGVEAAFPGPPRVAHAATKPRFAAVGPATRDALTARGFAVTFMPNAYRTEELARGLPDVDGRRVVLLRAETSNPALRRILQERGASVDDVAAYRTLPDDGAAPAGAQLLSPPPDWVLFTSPSTVEHFSSLWSPEELHSLQSAASAACIGPVTAHAARSHGWQIRVVAAMHTIPGLLDALTREVALHA